MIKNVIATLLLCVPAFAQMDDSHTRNPDYRMIDAKNAVYHDADVRAVARANGTRVYRVEETSPVQGLRRFNVYTHNGCRFEALMVGRGRGIFGDVIPRANSYYCP